MTIRKLLCTSLAAALVVSALPSPAYAGEIGSSVQRAAVRLAKEQPKPLLSNQVRRSETMEGQMPGGGGGGHTALIVGLLTTAVSLGATYYVVKQLKKDTGQQ